LFYFIKKRGRGESRTGTSSRENSLLFTHAAASQGGGKKKRSSILREEVKKRIIRMGHERAKSEYKTHIKLSYHLKGFYMVGKEQEDTGGL